MNTAPRVDVSAELNVAAHYVDGAVADGHGARVAYIHEDVTVTFADLQVRVNRVGNALARLGIEIEQRVGVLLPNVPEFVTSFFGAIKLGAVPAAMSFAVTPNEHAFLLSDSRARALITTSALWEPLRSRRSEFPFLRHVIIVGPGAQDGEHDFATLLRDAATSLQAAPTSPDDAAFWLHTSGSTGTPKWAVHLHRNMLYSERLYGTPYVQLRPGDVIVCGSPCFHAYPLAFTTYFALKAGATVVLNSERSTPARMFHLIRKHQPAVFVGVPTLYAQMLQAAPREDADLSSVRVCFAAAEPLPADLFNRWRDRFGVEILDGIGTTEVLHIFITNRPGEVRPGSSGRPVPGYRIRLVDHDGADVPQGEVGDLLVSGGSLFAGYWRRQDVTRRVFRGEWYVTGDKYRQDADGYYWYMGRADDLLRVSGHWVSPAEVEGALISHPAVLEAAVVGKEDGDKLIKPKAFVVLRDGETPTESLADALKVHVKATIAPYQYPRWIEFCDSLPKTATGKIQRFKLRELAARK
ncbi:MAG: benzoate-CoA ligase family protein [Proteobacteria bacterium]|nr:benzoate-CoA ligase family protein [Pseudomonadota bacterium]